MANLRISQLPSVTNAAVGGGAVFPLVDSTDGTTKKISLAEVDKRYASKAFEQLLTTPGDLITASGNPIANQRLAAGIAGRPLRSNGPSQLPGYQNPGLLLVNTNTVPNVTEATELILMDASNAVVQVNLPAPSTCPGKQFIIIRIDNGSNFSTFAQVNDPSQSVATIVAQLPPYFRFACSSDGTQYRASAIFQNAMVKSTSSTQNAFNPGTGVWSDLGSITVGPGEWDMSMMINVVLTGTAATGMMNGFIGTVAGNNTTGYDAGNNAGCAQQLQTAAGWAVTVNVPTYNVILNSTNGLVTYYLKAMYSAATSGLATRGWGIYARKIRNVYT